MSCFVNHAMGAAESTPAVKVDDGYFGVRVCTCLCYTYMIIVTTVLISTFGTLYGCVSSQVTASGGNSASVSQQAAVSHNDLEEAYAKGRSDAAHEFQAMIPGLGSQLYGEANRRIEENVLGAIEKEKALVRACSAYIYLPLSTPANTDCRLCMSRQRKSQRSSSGCSHLGRNTVWRRRGV